MRLVGKLTGEEDANVPVWKGAWQHRAACVPKLFFFVVGLVGGRFAMKLTARQLGSVVIGSFLVTFVAAVGSVYPSVPSEPTLTFMVTIALANQPPVALDRTHF